jgi:hypothetical protein
MPAKSYSKSGRLLLGSTTFLLAIQHERAPLLSRKWLSTVIKSSRQYEWFSNYPWFHRGTPVTRPKGQYKSKDGKIVFGPTNRLDYELEVAAFIGKASELGKSVSLEGAEDYIFGLVLLNDWSGKWQFWIVDIRADFCE